MTIAVHWSGRISASGVESPAAAATVRFSLVRCQLPSSGHRIGSVGPAGRFDVFDQRNHVLHGGFLEDPVPEVKDVA